MAIATLSRRTSYFALSRSPRYSVLFALPLLVVYELLAAAIAQPGRELRNGADVMLREAFTAVAGQRGPAIFMAAVVLLGLFLVVRDLRSSKARLRARVFGGMQWCSQLQRHSELDTRLVISPVPFHKVP